MSQSDHYQLEMLENLGIVHFDKEEEIFNPTIGGLLLFGDCPQRYLPHTGIRILDYTQAEKKEYVVSGNLVKMLDETTEKLKGILEGTSYPLEALVEAVSNAIVHRDYFDHSRDITIYIGKKRIEISNPGSIHGREVLNDVIRENNPYRRNNWLYHQLLVLDDEKRFMKYGLGLQKIKRIMKKKGKVRFLNLRKINLFKVVLPGIVYFK